MQAAAHGRLPPQAVAGSGLSFMVGRLSFTFGLTGPSVSTDTACSSSLGSAPGAQGAQAPTVCAWQAVLPDPPACLPSLCACDAPSPRGIAWPHAR